MTPKEIRDLNNRIKREHFVYTMWGNGRFLNGVSDVDPAGLRDPFLHMNALSCVDEIMRFTGIHILYRNAYAVMAALETSQSGVVAFAKTNSTLFTIIRHGI